MKLEKQIREIKKDMVWQAAVFVFFVGAAVVLLIKRDAVWFLVAGVMAVYSLWCQSANVREYRQLQQKKQAQQETTQS